MISLNDSLFIFWILASIATILVAPGRVSKLTYSRLMAGVFLASCLVTIWFHETVIDVSQQNPIHGAILALAQIGTLTLTSKLWFSINYKQLNHFARFGICIFLYVSLTTIVIGSYWLYKLLPELQLLLYPFSSLAISVTAEILEDRWNTQQIS